VGFLDILLSETAFPSLKMVELFGVMGISDQPLVSSWTHVPTDQHPLLSKLSSRASIDRVRIHVGENRRLRGGYPADWVLWEEDNRELVGPPSIIHHLSTDLRLLVGGGEGRVWEDGGESFEGVG